MGVFLYNLFLLWGTDLLPAQEAFVINYLWPAFIILFACILLHEKFTLGKFIAILFSFAGIVVVVTNGDLSNMAAVNLKGIVFCLIAAVCYGLYSTLNKKEAYDKNISVLLSYASSTVIAFILVFIKGSFYIPTPAELIGIAYSGIMCNGLAYLLWARAMDQGNTAIIANMAYLTPFISLLVTHYVLGERIGMFSVLGLVFIVLGLCIQIISEKSAKKKIKK